MTERIPLRRLPVPPRSALAPTWRAARPARIAAALRVASAADPGGWYVVGSSGSIPRRRAVSRVVAGREIVLWRDDRDASRTRPRALRAGDDACPHLGARLGGCEVREGAVVCSWHGLALGAQGARPAWATHPAYDDGVLAWVRLPTDGEGEASLPTLPPRPDPATAIAAVVSCRAVCEPRDIIANRLDPWHGAWFHPYAFSHLEVDESASDDTRLVLDVAYRVAGSFAVPVRAEFTCPDARTIVMTITDGEGTGSVVETHATPLGRDDRGRPLTVMTEATIATSPRAGFAAARRFAPLVRAGMRASAGRLWVDDLRYAERLWELRSRGWSPGGARSPRAPG